MFLTSTINFINVSQPLIPTISPLIPPLPIPVPVQNVRHRCRHLLKISTTTLTIRSKPFKITRYRFHLQAPLNRPSTTHRANGPPTLSSPQTCGRRIPSVPSRERMPESGSSSPLGNKYRTHASLPDPPNWNLIRGADLKLPASRSTFNFRVDKSSRAPGPSAR